MEHKTESPTRGQAGEALGLSNAADASEHSIINVVCTGLAPSGKAVFCRSKSGNTACFPLSQVELVTGEMVKGQEIAIKLPNWLLERARAERTNKQPDIRFTDKVLVSGIKLDASEKAIQVRCDADMVLRWFALSKIDIEGDGIPCHGEAVRLTCPAWMLRTRAGFFPSWTAGAIVQ